MQIEPLVTLIVKRTLSRLLRKIVLAVVMTVFAVIAIYYFGAAVMVALTTDVGLVTAQLIVGGIYAILAAVCFIILWAAGRKNAAVHTLAANRSREALILMVLEALILGYQLARKRDRDS